MSARNHRWRTVGCGCCAGVLLGGFLCVMALVLGTRRLAREVIASDIADYVRIAEGAEIDEGTRGELLDQLERIRAHARHGDIGFFSWLNYEESLEDLVEDGDLSDRDAAAIMRELDRLEEELETTRGEPREEAPADPGPPLVRARPEQPARRTGSSGLGILGFCAGLA